MRHARVDRRQDRMLDFIGSRRIHSPVTLFAKDEFINFHWQQANLFWLLFGWPRIFWLLCARKQANSPEKLTGRFFSLESAQLLFFQSLHMSSLTRIGDGERVGYSDRSVGRPPEYRKLSEGERVTHALQMLDGFYQNKEKIAFLRVLLGKYPEITDELTPLLPSDLAARLNVAA